MELKVIARYKCDFKTKFGLPRQSGIAPSITGEIIFEDEYRDENALRGIEEYSHLWLLWGFENEGKNEKRTVTAAFKVKNIGSMTHGAEGNGRRSFNLKEDNSVLTFTGV